MLDQDRVLPAAVEELPDQEANEKKNPNRRGKQQVKSEGRNARGRCEEARTESTLAPHIRKPTKSSVALTAPAGERSKC
jgi:hypothetical protein